MRLRRRHEETIVGISREKLTLLYYTRAVWSRRVRCALACAMVAAPWTFVAAQPEAPATPALHIALGAASAERVAQLSATTQHALTLFNEWLGPYPATSLTVAEAPWPSPAVVSAPGTVPIPDRWIELDRDPAAERRLIAAIASHYWHDALAEPPEQRWFAEALVRYFAARAIDTVLEGRQYWSSRYFGGFVPYATRLPLSPFGADARGHVRSFDHDLGVPPGTDERRVARAVAALFTLERFLGWPALQQGVMTYRAQATTRGAAPAALAAVLSEQRGGDLRWFFGDALNTDKTFDYAIERLSNDADGTRFDVRVELRRRGDAVFGIDAAARGPAVPVVLNFADGTEIVESWYGGEASPVFEYQAATPAVRAAVDPDAMLLLDQDRTNNVWRRDPAAATSVSRRATLSWLTWVEDLMLTCLALV